MFTPILNSPSWLTFMQSDFQMFLLIAQFFSALATIIGIIIALQQFRTTNKNRSADLINKQFDYTSYALDLFFDQIQPSLRNIDFNAFDTNLKNISYTNDDSKIVTEILTKRITNFFLDDSDYSQVFASEITRVLLLISRLSGFIHYKKTNELQLLSVISYDISRFTNHPGILQYTQLMSSQTGNNNFEIVFKTTDAYLKSRRLQND